MNCKLKLPTVSESSNLRKTTRLLSFKAVRSLLPATIISVCSLNASVAQGAEASGHSSYYHQVEEGEAKTLKCEVAVYGGTPGGVTAAVQAAKMGRKVILLSFNKHVGGLTSGGLTATDVGAKSSIGGMAKDFYDEVGGILDFSAVNAEALYRKMLSDAGVTVLYNRCLNDSVLKDGKLISISMETGETIKASMFIDATYEGDLIAAANVSYHVGREPASTYGESLGGQWQTVSWEGVYQFCGLPISPYVIPGDAKSGLLPEISAEPAGKPGEGDFKIQAYNFRMHLTQKEGKVTFPKPKGYDAGRFALLARFLNFDPKVRWTLNYTTRPMTDGPVQMREGDSNNAGSFSSDYVGGSNTWPDGIYKPGSFATLPAPRRGITMPWRELYQLREKVFQDHVSYQQGQLYFLANDPQIPKELQDRVNTFGLHPDEFKETANWPHQLYVREGRRMLSDYVMTQADCESKRVAKDSVGLASYAMDSHFCQRVVVVENGKTFVRNEGGFGHDCPKAYPISYRSIVPKESECTNLLVPVMLSSSHVAFGSIRMEPVFMILGQSAGTAASMAIEGNISVQKVDYAKLKERLLADGQKL